MVTPLDKHPFLGHPLHATSHTIKVVRADALTTFIYLSCSPIFLSSLRLRLSSLNL